MDISAPRGIYKTLLRSSKDLDAFIMADMFNLEWLYFILYMLILPPKHKHVFVHCNGHQLECPWEPPEGTPHRLLSLPHKLHFHNSLPRLIITDCIHLCLFTLLGLWHTRCFSMSRILPWQDGSFQVISFRG